MPEWMTPLLWPVWWAAICGSFSSSSSRRRGWASVRASAVARPTMPPPTTARSALWVTAERIPSLGQLEHDGAVIRAQDPGQDARARDPAAQLVGDEEVVDAPAHVPRPRSRLQIPPGVVPRVRHEEAEGVVVARRDEAGHPLALGGQEARRRLVLPRAGEVELGVRGVHVAADHDPLAPLPERLREREERLVEGELVPDALRTHSPVREVDVEQMEVGQLDVHETALAVQHRVVADDARRERGRAGVGDHPAVAGTLREGPVAGVTSGGPHLVGHLLGLELGLLHADEVGGLGGQEPGEPLLPRRAKPVDVPGDELHERPRWSAARSSGTKPTTARPCSMSRYVHLFSEHTKNTSKRRLSGATRQRSTIWAMSRWLHHTESSRGPTGRSAAVTRPMRWQIIESGVVSAKWRARASPQILLQP